MEFVFFYGVGIELSWAAAQLDDSVTDSTDSDWLSRIRLGLCLHIGLLLLPTQKSKEKHERRIETRVLFSNSNTKSQHIFYLASLEIISFLFLSSLLSHSFYDRRLVPAVGGPSRIPTQRKKKEEKEKL